MINCICRYIQTVGKSINAVKKTKSDYIDILKEPQNKKQFVDWTVHL